MVLFFALGSVITLGAADALVSIAGGLRDSIFAIALITSGVLPTEMPRGFVLDRGGVNALIGWVSIGNVNVVICFD